MLKKNLKEIWNIQFLKKFKTLKNLTDWFQFLNNDSFHNNYFIFN